jgi:hypothetical protein
MIDSVNDRVMNDEGAVEVVGERTHPMNRGITFPQCMAHAGWVPIKDRFGDEYLYQHGETGRKVSTSRAWTHWDITGETPLP